MCNLGGTANLPIRGMATTATIFLVLVLVGVILSGVNIIVGIVSIVALSHRRVVTLSSSLLLVLTAFAAAIALTSVINNNDCCCSPPSMVGCCAAYSIVCHPICHPSPLLLRKHQHFCCWPPSLIANLPQPLSYPSPLPLPSMVGCCVLCPPNSILTEPPS